MEITDKPKSGWQTTSVTDANPERAKELIRKGRRIRVQDVGIALNTSYGSVKK